VNRRIALIITGIVAVAVAALVVVVFTLGDGDGKAKSKSKGNAVQVAAPLEGTDPPTDENATVPPESAPSEEPTVRPYATALTGREYKVDPTRTQPAKNQLPPYATGCDYDYGKPPQCVPWTFPPEVETVQDRCDWLKDQGFKTITVRGKDRHGLDADKNGIACDN
jgi:hypothetical protein